MDVCNGPGCEDSCSIVSCLEVFNEERGSGALKCCLRRQLISVWTRAIVFIGFSLRFSSVLLLSVVMRPRRLDPAHRNLKRCFP